MFIRRPVQADQIASPDHVADYLMCDSRERGDALTNLKLQKLLYYAQAWYLAQYDIPIFEEDFQAWVHGPVLLSQYHRFKSSEWRPIQDTIRLPQALPPKLVRHLKKIIRTFGVETATALELMTHEEAPWIRARKGIPAHVSSNSIIDKASMREFYRAMIPA
jgi:uncharacterized phage-associated protein